MKQEIGAREGLEVLYLMVQIKLSVKKVKLPVESIYCIPFLKEAEQVSLIFKTCILFNTI